MNEAEIMLTNILDCSRVELYTRNRELSALQQERLNRMKERRKNGEPLQYIVGECDFMGTILKVDERVLIPRPETEILVYHAVKTLTLKQSPYLRVLDLGTGSGNIAITLAKSFEDIEVVALDRSKEALELAYENAKSNNVAGKIWFLEDDMNAFLSKPAQSMQKFDLVISNPPYIKSGSISSLPEDVRREPHIALDGGEDGFKFIDAIINNACRFIKHQGFLMMEIGDGQSIDVLANIKNKNSYINVSFIKDYTSVDRILTAQVS